MEVKTIWIIGIGKHFRLGGLKLHCQKKKMGSIQFFGQLCHYWAFQECKKITSCAQHFFISPKIRRGGAAPRPPIFYVYVNWLVQLLFKIDNFFNFLTIGIISEYSNNAFLDFRSPKPTVGLKYPWFYTWWQLWNKQIWELKLCKIFSWVSYLTRKFGKLLWQFV